MNIVIYRSIWRRREGAVVRWQALGTSSALRLQRVLPHISSSSLSDFDGFFSFPRREGKISHKRKERKLVHKIKVNKKGLKAQNTSSHFKEKKRTS